MMQIKESSPSYKKSKKIYTYQDYLELPEDRNRYEILEGELVVSPSPKKVHQRLLLKIIIELNRFVEEQNRGKIFISPFDVIFDEKNIVQPDILYIAKEHHKIITDDNIQGVPDMIIEILSPSTAYYDLIEKKTIYEKFGVREYWIVDPKRQWIEAYVLQQEKYELFQRQEKSGTIQSKIIEGFEISLKDIFEQETE